MIAAAMATIDPGEEAVIFDPYYENYMPDTIISGARPRFVPLYRNDDGFYFDRDELRAAFNEKTKGDHHLQSEQPDGKSFHARRDGVHRRAVQRVRHALLH
jgi:aminotransferase